MSNGIRVVQYGLGPIGSAIARHVLERSGLELVGGVDIDPAKVGRDVGAVIGLNRSLGFAVLKDLASILEHRAADVALHATQSQVEPVGSQMTEILSAGLDVVSTAEELSFPWLDHPEQAAEIDAIARQMDKTVLATGVNPGFIMDTLPLALTALCQRVDHIEVTRVVNASSRRRPFQAKIGSGMAVDEFEARVAAGQIGHVGLSESIGMVFNTLGRDVIGFESEVAPVVAEAPVRTDHVHVEPGQVKGLRQIARGYAADGEFVCLTFIAALEAENEGDTIRIQGNPSLEMKLNGTNGDIATVAMVVNAIPRVMAAPPGLVTMPDLPIVTIW
jgi:hypothetical protein